LNVYYYHYKSPPEPLQSSLHLSQVSLRVLVGVAAAAAVVVWSWNSMCLGILGTRVEAVRYRHHRHWDRRSVDTLSYGFPLHITLWIAAGTAASPWPWHLHLNKICKHSVLSWKL